MRRHGIAVVLAIVVTAMAIPAAGHDPDCLESLWQAPLETVSLPDGWSVISAQVELDGSILMVVDGPVLGTEEHSGEEIRASASVLVACLPDPRRYIERQARFDGIMGRNPIDLLPIGDWSRATQGTQALAADFAVINREIDWVHGEVYGGVSSFEFPDAKPVEWQDLSGIAAAFDTVLP